MLKEPNRLGKEMTSDCGTLVFEDDTEVTFRGNHRMLHYPKRVNSKWMIVTSFLGLRGIVYCEFDAGKHRINQALTAGSLPYLWLYRYSLHLECCFPHWTSAKSVFKPKNEITGLTHPPYCSAVWIFCAPELRFPWELHFELCENIKRNVGAVLKVLSNRTGNVHMTKHWGAFAKLL